MHRKPLAFAVLAAATLAALPALATFHLMKVVEVFRGTAAAPDAQYVVLQMYAGSQNFVGGESVTIFNANGTVVHTFTFPADLSPTGTTQRKILIATTQAETFFNLQADLEMTPDILAAGGKACWAGTIDCVAWGSWSGSSTGVGPAFSPTDGLLSGRAAKRRLDISGGATTLEATDDTDNSANDFVFGTPAPRNYANVDGTIPAATCGNGALEGLEQCDDHNLASGDGCSSTCQVDTVAATISIADATTSEGDAGTKQLTFTVRLSQAAPGPVTYDIATADGTALAGSDYVAASAIGETIPAGTLSKTFAVTLNGDTTVEPNENFSVGLTNVAGAGVVDALATGTITNDDVNLLTIADASIVEGNSGTKTLTFTAQLAQPATQDVTFNATTANGTTTAADFTAVILTGQLIPTGQSSKAIAVTIKGDTTQEADETFTLTLGNIQGANSLDPVATGTILNDDTALLSIADLLVGEGNAGTKQATFQVKLSQLSSTPVTYDIATGTSGTATAGVDFVAASATGETIPAGALARSFAVTINGDTTAEPNETFPVNVTNVAGASLADGLATGFILNDEGVTLSVADVSVAEGNAGTSLATFTVKLSQASGSPVNFNVATINGSASSASDYVAVSLSGQSIPAGQTTKTFTVTINGDTSPEGNETFLFNVTGVTGATVFDGQAVGTILNDDGPTLSIADVAVAEGTASAGSATFTVRLSQASANPVSYNIATLANTATAGVDYTSASYGGWVISPGLLSGTFVVPISNDATVEPNENFFVAVSNVVGATVFDGSAVGTILNDDGPHLSVNDVMVGEGNAGTKLATFTVTLTPASAGATTYTIATANGTATAGSDYVASTLTGQSIPAGMTAKTFAVTLDGDTTAEANETFTANLSAASGATVFDGQGTGTLLNDDGPTLSIGDVAIAEGNSGTSLLTFTVTLSQAAGTDVTYNIATVGSTASPGVDYVSKSLVGETIPAGQLSRPFSVAINGDTTAEANEAFFVQLTAASGATIFDGAAIGTITNDD